MWEEHASNGHALAVRARYRLLRPQAPRAARPRRRARRSMTERRMRLGVIGISVVASSSAVRARPLIGQSNICTSL